MMQRRQALLLAAGLPLLARADDSEAAQTLALAWRLPDGRDQAGLLRLDWAARRIELQAAWTLPSRAHGLIADGAGGFYAVAARAGDWLLHVDSTGQPQWRRQDGPWRFNGHLLLHEAGLFATETDPRDDSAHLALRDPQTLALIARWPLAGRDAHQLVADAQGRLMLALGGIPRRPDGGKRALEQMAPALLRLDAASGRELARWKLDDARLSLRHLAWSNDGRRLGIALQAEHDEAAQREQAPLLAVFENEALNLPVRGAEGLGYAGDLCAAPGGGFVLSAQKAGLGLLWHPDAPTRWIRMAELSEICALQAQQGGAVLMLAQRGLARWQRSGAQMLAWPQAMVPDNHALMLT